MKPLLFMVAAAYLVSLAACKQKEPAPRIPITDVRLKEALLIKTGSYFVYIDSITGVRDSFYFVIDAYAGYRHNEDKNIDYEQVSQCAAYHATKSRSSIGYGVGRGRQDAIDWIFEDEHGQYAGRGILVKLPFNEGMTEDVYGETITAVKHYDSFSNYGRTYSDVYEVQSVNGPIQSHTFFSMQSGAVIRCTTNISGAYRVYNLVNSKTIR